MPTKYPGIDYLAGERITTGRNRNRLAQGGGWKDLLCHYTPRAAGLQIPALTTVGASPIQLPRWQVNDLAYYSFHIPHDYHVGTDVHFHVHWMSDGTDVNPVNWQVSYYYAQGLGPTFPIGSPATIVTFQEAATGSAYSHMITESAALTIANLEPDGFVLCELKRITNGGTDNANNIFAWNMDIHYQSIEESTQNKNGPWNI